MSKKTGKEVKTNNIISDIVYAAGRNGSTVMAGHKYRHKDWTTEAFLLDRRNLNLNILDEDLEFNGIYFLIGHSDGYVDENIYVGQSKIRNNSKDSIMARLREHNTSTTESYRDKWDTVVAVTSMTGDWRADTVCALEHLFFNLIPKSNCLNTVVPPSCTTPDDYDSYTEKIKQIKVYLAMLGVNTFEEKETAESVEDTVNNIVVSDEKFEDLSPEARIPEIVTPKRVVDMMIDSLDKANPDIWNKDTVFLDPACKGGEFLKAIYDKLMKSESMIREFSNEICRSNHILQYQIFGIALSERSKDRTSLSLNGYDRNIVIVNDYIKTLKGDLSSGIPLLGKTVTFREYLGHQFGRDNMRFDVVMGNSPYQESNDGGGKGGGSAIWQLFVNEAKQLSPIYICMITPSRWFTGGKGLEKFQRDWLQDEHIDNIYHYDNATALFPGTLIAGGVSYFIWNRDKQGNDVNFTANGGETCRRKLNEFDVFVTDQTAADIIKKINSIDNGRNRLNDICMDKYYYGIKASYICRGESDLRILSSHGYRPGRSVDVDHQPEGYRVITSSMTPNDVKAPFNVLNPVQIIEPDVVPEAGYITFGGYKTLAEAEALKKYLNSKFARLLIRLRKIGVNANVKAYKFVPLQDFTSSSDIDWTQSIQDIDKQLYKKYNLSQEEIDYIERTIKPMA